MPSKPRRVTSGPKKIRSTKKVSRKIVSINFWAVLRMGKKVRTEGTIGPGKGTIGPGKGTIGPGRTRERTEK